MDTTVLVAILTKDPFTDRAYRYLHAATPALIVSDFAGAEFPSAVSRRVRMGELTIEAARHAFMTFDGLAPQTVDLVETSPADIKNAATLIRRLDLPLRAPDALNIAIAQRLGADLMTFDAKMAGAAKILGVDVAAA